MNQIAKQVWEGRNPPFSFLFGGRSTAEIMGNWEVGESQENAPGGKLKHRCYREPETGLEVIAHIRTFDEFAAVDWMLELKNGGPASSPIIEQIMPLNLNCDLLKDARILLHHARGSECRIDDFLPLCESLHAGQTSTLSPRGGRSSDGTLPFMSLQWPGGGLALGIGWSGKWMARFARTEEGVLIEAGMERTRLYLEPGERIRTPRVLLIDWEGEQAETGSNLMRRLLLAHYCPRRQEELALPPVAHMTMSTYHRTRELSQERELEALEHTAALGGEAFWMDACWFGSGRNWPEEVGNWQIRTDLFPEGLKVFGEAAHQADMKYVLWFEPERVRKGTHIDREHPEYLLYSAGDAQNALLNLGLPEVRDYITGVVSEIIGTSGVDVYRQDFNFDPLPFWQEADVPDREGMSEIRHVEGLYLFWDELCRRHPQLIIDNCASGGRRIDLETTSRSFPLWRSDFSDVGGPAWGGGLQVGDQCQTAGLSRWVPLHTAAVWSFSPYAFRSAMSTGVVLYSDIRAEDFPEEEARRAILELKGLRPYFLADFYPLLPLTTAYHDWCAYQFHRPAEGDGFALFLRRHESPFSVMEIALRKIDPQAAYSVGMAISFDDPARQEMSGEELSRLRIEIPEMPGSLLVRYARL